jgi:hypothetical protein
VRGNGEQRAKPMPARRAVVEHGIAGGKHLWATLDTFIALNQADALRQIDAGMGDVRERARAKLEKEYGDPSADDEVWLITVEVMEQAELMVELSKRSLSVLLGAYAENWIKRFLKEAGEEIGARAEWRAINAAWEQAAGSPLQAVSGYETIDRVRGLANAFKHRDGMPDAGLVKRFDYPEGKEICYELEDWAALIDRSVEFIFHAYSVLEQKILLRIWRDTSRCED